MQFWGLRGPLSGFCRGKRGVCRPPRPSCCITGAVGSGRPGDSFQVLEAWVWVSWGRPHPGVPDLTGCLSLSVVAVKVCVPIGIRELLAAPDGNPAFDRQCPQGLFPWEHRAVRPVGSGPLRAQGWQPPLVPAFVPIFGPWSGCVAQRREWEDAAWCSGFCCLRDLVS